MKIGANELKVGNIIQHNNSLWKVGKLSHTQPGKGGAYVQAELKNISNQSKLNERFRSSESIERVRSEQIEHQFLFRSGDEFTFMNSVKENAPLEIKVLRKNEKGVEEEVVLKTVMTKIKVEQDHVFTKEQELSNEQKTLFNAWLTPKEGH